MGSTFSMLCHVKVFLFNGPSPASFSFYFCLLNKRYIFFYQDKLKCQSCIQYRDLNPRPLERESPNITTKPGLPPLSRQSWFILFIRTFVFCVHTVLELLLYHMTTKYSNVVVVVSCLSLTIEQWYNY